MARKNTHKNQNAEIKTRIDRTGKLRTETRGRDEDSITIAVSTNSRDNSTRMFVNNPDGSSYKFDGRTARTIYRILQKHYMNTDKMY